MGNQVKQKITETLEKNYMPYAMSVIISRAIPEIDGFKPAHRKLLYTMYKMSLLNGKRTKSANIVGQTMKLNPHGDMAIYETMVRLTKGNEALNTPLIDSKGNFGKQYSRDMAYAAPRYTEAKLAGACEELFRDIDKNTVEFIDNYDGTMKEPKLLPITFPSILVNPNQGIAVGMANNICGFNLQEVCEATIAYLKDENVSLIEYMPAPDFTSGGDLIYNQSDMMKIYETGKGSFKVRARYRYDKKQNCIEIYQIPYTTTIEVIIEKIIDMVKEGKIKEITDVRDETDLSGLKITLDIKRNTDVELLMGKLYKYTTLEDSFRCNFNVLINGHPRVLGVKSILKEWTQFRIQCIERRVEYEIDKMKKKRHLLLGLKEILLDIDKAIKIIRETEKDKDVIANLMHGFGIDETQAEYIADIKLRNLNKEYILKRTDELDELDKEIDKQQKILESKNKIKKLVIKDLKQVIKRYGIPRNTQIIHQNEIETVTEEDLIKDYGVKIFFTNQQYIKKITLASLRAYSEQKVKEDDYIKQEIEAQNKSDLLLFSNKQKVYKMKLYELEDCKASSLGTYLPNVLDMDMDERIVFVHVTIDYSGFFLFGFENGKVSKVEAKSYYTKTNRKKLLKAYSDISNCIGMAFCQNDTDVVVERDDDRLLVFDTSQLQMKSNRSIQGVQVLKLSKKTKMTKLFLTTGLEKEIIEIYRGNKIPMSGKVRK